MWGFFSPHFYALLLLFIAILLPRLASGYKGFPVVIKARELVVETALHL
jgi:hypothetical protein